MTEPEYATFRDLVEVVDRVDTKLDEHKLETERRLGRIERGLVAVGLLALVPHFSLKAAPFLEGAVHSLHIIH